MVRCTKKSLTSAFGVPTMGLCGAAIPPRSVLPEGHSRVGADRRYQASGSRLRPSSNRRKGIAMNTFNRHRAVRRTEPGQRRASHQARRAGARERREADEAEPRRHQGGDRPGRRRRASRRLDQGRAGPVRAARQVRRVGRPARDRLLARACTKWRRKPRRNTRRWPKKRGPPTPRASPRGSRRPRSRLRPARKSPSTR